MVLLFEVLQNKTKVLVNVDLNDIFYQLHDAAKKEALKGQTDFELINFGISEIKKTFIGACDCVVTVSKTEKAIPNFISKYENNVDVLKDQCFNILLTYVRFFIGEKQAKELDKDQMLAIEYMQEANESILIDYKKTLFENLFEKDSTTNGEHNEQSQEDIKSDDQKDNIQNDKSDDIQKFIIGYSLKYSCDYEGVKRGPMQATLQWAALAYKNSPIIRGIVKGSIILTGKAIKSLFNVATNAIANSKLLKDLSKLKIGTFGKHSVNIGLKAADLAKTAGKIAGKTLDTTAKAAKSISKLAGKTFGKLDFAQIVLLFKKGLDKKYYKNDLIVEPMSTDIITVSLKQQGKFDSSIQDKINKFKVKYLIGIMANKSDKYYSKYNIDNFIKIYNDAVSTSSNVWTKASIDESNVIKIADYNPRNEVKPDNIEDKNESLELRTNALMKVIFENYHDYILLSEADDQLVKDFRSLFLDADGKINTKNRDTVAEKLNNDTTFDSEKALLNKLKRKDLIQIIKEIDDESKLNALIGRYTSGQSSKLKYLYDTFSRYLDATKNKVDDIVDLFIVDDKFQKSRVQHIVKMFKQSSELSDDYFEIEGKIKDKSQFCQLLSNCKNREDLYALFDNYSTPATLKLFYDKIIEYFRKNKLKKEDKVDLYLIFKQHIFELNLDKQKDQ